MKTSVSVLTLLALVGCGSGGGSDEATAPQGVSTATPVTTEPSTKPVEAPQAPNRVQPIQPQPAKPVSPPVAAPTPAPVVSKPPLQEQPVGGPVKPIAPIEQPVIASIPGELLTKIISRRYDRTTGGGLDQAVGARSEQIVYNNPEVLGQYDHLSFIDNKPTYWVHTDRTRIVNQWTLDNVKVDTVGDFTGGFTYNDTEPVYLGNLSTWVAQGNQPWSVSLSLDTDPRGYKLCWTFVMPNSQRLSCGLFTTDGDHAGIEVTDQGVTIRN